MASHEHDQARSVSALLGSKHETQHRFVLVRPHGYIDDNGRHIFWNVGDIVTGADAKLLQEQKAPLKRLDD